MIAGVTNDGPSQVTPRYGGAKFDAGSRTLYAAPDCSPSILNPPLSSVFAEPTTREPLSSSTLIPGSPFSCGSMTPGRPPPPATKSSQMTPVTLLGSAAAGWAAGLAPDGTPDGGTPTSGTSCVVPARTC